MLVARDGRIQLANPACERMFGRSRDELLALHSEQLVAEPLRKRHIAQRRLYFQRMSDRVAHVQLRALRRAGDEFPVEVAVCALKATQPSAAIVTIDDISLRNAREVDQARRLRALERSNAELEQFALVASHDIREPLRMMSSYAKLLSEQLAGQLDARAERFMGYVLEGAQRMQRLIDDLLAYSRLEISTPAPRPASSEIALRDALASLRGVVDETRASVTHGALPPLLFDPVQLEQLFQNLLHNALKFRRGDAPAIHIAADPYADAMWRISVADNGIGIEPQYAEQIFRMFARLHDRTKFDGSGIGLAMAKKIVERHGGQIWVESQPGRGSTFYFTARAAPVRAS